MFEALMMLHDFLDDMSVFKHEFVFLSCGEFDGNHLAKESKKK